MFWLCEPFGRLVLRWSGSVTDHHKLLLLNQTYVLGNVRSELLFVYSCWLFLSVLLLFFATDIHTFVYFALFLKGFFIWVVWCLECTPVITSHLQNGSAFAFLHLLSAVLGLWIFNACSKGFVAECEWFGFCRWMSPCVGMFAPWIYFLCPDTRNMLGVRDWIAPPSGRLSVCNAAFAMFFL